MDFMALLMRFIETILWALVAAVSMSLTLGILLKVYDLMTPIDEWEEIKKGNIACAILMGAVIMSFGLVVMAAILAP